MSFCPNPSCPHRRRVGRPAELVAGIALCPDCGAELVEAEPRPSLAESRGARLPAPVARRVSVTVAAMVLYWLALLVPSPVLDLSAITSVDGVSFAEVSAGVGPFAVGLGPFLVAFVLVELAVLVFRPRRRHGDQAFRRGMTRVALGLGVALALAQAYGQALYLEGLAWSSPALLALPPGLGLRGLHVAATAGGSVLLAAAALYVGRAGLGNGFAVLLLAEQLVGLPWFAARTFEAARLSLVSPAGLVAAFGAAAALVAAAAWYLTRGDRSPARLPLRLPTCGTLPLEVAVTIVSLPVTLGSVFVLPSFLRVVEALRPGTLRFVAYELVLVAALVPVFSLLFYWRRRAALATPANRGAWHHAWLLSGAFLVAVVLAHHLVTVAGVALALGEGTSLLGLVVAVAIGADLWAELAARKRAPGGQDLVALESHQDLADAIEAAAAIPAERAPTIQGLRYRSLTYLFGPFVPLAVLGLPAARQAEPAEPGRGQ